MGWAKQLGASQGWACWWDMGRWRMTCKGRVRNNVGCRLKKNGRKVQVGISSRRALMLPHVVGFILICRRGIEQKGFRGTGEMAWEAATDTRSRWHAETIPSFWSSRSCEVSLVQSRSELCCIVTCRRQKGEVMLWHQNSTQKADTCAHTWTTSMTLHKSCWRIPDFKHEEQSSLEWTAMSCRRHFVL